MTIFWIFIFLISIVALAKGADYLLVGAEKIGKFFKLQPFIIGALIVGIGTSLPELASSIAATLSGENSIVVSNAVGSNIANILLVAGLSAIFGKKILERKKTSFVENRIISTKNLLNTEAPLLILSTLLFIVITYDGIIFKAEAFFIFIAFFIYLSYLLFNKEEETSKISKKDIVKKISAKDFLYLIGGGLILSLGANYLIEAVISLSQIWQINPELISISAIAIGTSLPEILVSVSAVFKGKSDVAFGNIFGSNVFNMLMIAGSIGIFTNLSVDEKTLSVGIPFLAVSTFIFLVSVLSQKIYIWEGLMFILFYAFFLFKIFGII